jgi:hypothetical protein
VFLPVNAFYWALDTDSSQPLKAFSLDLADGHVYAFVKPSAIPVRAVRGGL